MKQLDKTDVCLWNSTNSKEERRTLVLYIDEGGFCSSTFCCTAGLITGHLSLTAVIQSGDSSCMIVGSTLGRRWNLRPLWSCICSYLTSLLIFFLHFFNQSFSFLKLAKFHQHNTFKIFVRDGTVWWKRWFWKLMRKCPTIWIMISDKDEVNKSTKHKWVVPWLMCKLVRALLIPQSKI